MTTMGKTLFVILGLGVLIGATLALRGDDTPAPRAQLTTAQRAEMQPPPKPADPPKASATPAPGPENQAESRELEPEDGSGS